MGVGGHPLGPCAPSIELKTDFQGKTTLALLLTPDKLSGTTRKMCFLLKQENFKGWSKRWPNLDFI